MDRNEYIKYRTSNSPQPMYEYYKEKYKGKNPIDEDVFFQALRMWPDANEAFRSVLRHYDIQFDVISVQNLKTGLILKYI